MVNPLNHPSALQYIILHAATAAILALALLILICAHLIRGPPKFQVPVPTPQPPSPEWGLLLDAVLCLLALPLKVALWAVQFLWTMIS